MANKSHTHILESIRKGDIEAEKLLKWINSLSIKQINDITLIDNESAYTNTLMTCIYVSNLNVDLKFDSIKSCIIKGGDIFKEPTSVNNETLSTQSFISLLSMSSAYKTAKLILSDFIIEHYRNKKLNGRDQKAIINLIINSHKELQFY